MIAPATLTIERYMLYEIYDVLIALFQVFEALCQQMRKTNMITLWKETIESHDSIEMAKFLETLLSVIFVQSFLIWE